MVFSWLNCGSQETNPQIYWSWHTQQSGNVPFICCQETLCGAELYLEQQLLTGHMGLISANGSGRESICKSNWNSLPPAAPIYYADFIPS